MSQRYQRIQALEKTCPLTELCAAFEVSRRLLRLARTQARGQANARRLAEIQVLRPGEEVCCGSPRRARELQGRGHPCSENRIARLMRAHDRRAQTKPRFGPCAPASQHDEPIAPNRLAERAAPDGPNQVWRQDLPQVPTAQGWLFLARVMDLWSRQIVGWAMADHLRSELGSTHSK